VRTSPRGWKSRLCARALPLREPQNPNRCVIRLPFPAHRRPFDQPAAKSQAPRHSASQTPRPQRKPSPHVVAQAKTPRCGASQTRRTKPSPHAHQKQAYAHAQASFASAPSTPIIGQSQSESPQCCALILISCFWPPARPPPAQPNSAAPHKPNPPCGGRRQFVRRPRHEPLVPTTRTRTGIRLQLTTGSAESSFTPIASAPGSYLFILSCASALAHRVGRHQRLIDSKAMARPFVPIASANSVLWIPPASASGELPRIRAGSPAVADPNAGIHSNELTALSSASHQARYPSQRAARNLAPYGALRSLEQHREAMAFGKACSHDRHAAHGVGGHRQTGTDRKT